ncbi:MAG: Sorbitol-6-phosphate 2-dehydrogenase, partial [uncultured Sphingomonas sp.]
GGGRGAHPCCGRQRHDRAARSHRGRVHRQAGLRGSRAVA